MPRRERPLPPSAPLRWRRRWAVVGAVALLAIAGGAWFAGDWWFCLPADAQADYVGGEACRRCHEKQFDLWRGSDHDKAMDHARPDTVLGDFDNAEATYFGETTKFYRRDGKYCVLTEGPGGKPEEFEVQYVFGVYPLQQYLVPFPNGRYQCLPFAWDVDRKRWFHLYPNEKIDFNDALHWTRPLQNWNYMCADCHSTNLRRNFDVKTKTYHTTWSEINVSCETCHGPGSLHVKLADSKWFFWDRRRGYALPNLKSADNRVEVETCAPCHARRRIMADHWKGGDRFGDHFVPELTDRATYYADGQILDEDYEYGSFIQSKMYHNKVRCSDCHDPHSLHVKFSERDPSTGRYKVVDNRVCGQCHLPATYDTPKHHFHPGPDKQGTLCIECHMPTTPYMVVDPRLDHSIRVPRPQLTVDLGIPNACNKCHNDAAKGETPQWAVDKVKQWYKHGTESPHYAYAIDAGRKGEPRAERMLEAVTRRQDLSAMVRSSAISLLSNYPDGLAAARRGLTDPDPLVRVTSVRCMERLPPDEAWRDVGPLLHDPLRAVRIEAARILAGIHADELLPKDRVAYEQALAEFFAGQESLGDQSGAHLSMGVVHFRMGDVKRAEKEYRLALSIDPDFVQARFNLAVLFNSAGRNEEAAALLRDAIKIAQRQRDLAEQQARQIPALREQLAAAKADSPEHRAIEAQLAALTVREQEVAESDLLLGEAHYSLGLLLAEDEKQLAQAAAELAIASRLLPANPRVHYNYGLAMQKLRRLVDAEAALRQAHELAPGNLEIANSLTQVYIELRDWRRALPLARRCAELAPNEPGFRRRAELIEQRVEAMTDDKDLDRP